MKNVVYIKNPKNPRTILVPPLVVTPLAYTTYPTLDKTACHFLFQVNNGTKMVCVSYFAHKFIYFLRSKCNNNFGIKPILLSNGEQFNDHTSNDYRSRFNKIKWPCNKIVYMNNFDLRRHF